MPSAGKLTAGRQVVSVRMSGAGPEPIRCRMNPETVSRFILTEHSYCGLPQSRIWSSHD